MRLLQILVACSFAVLSSPIIGQGKPLAELEIQPVVRLDQGAVRGVRDQGITVYRNIPYAAAPVGELRWKTPQSAPHWQGVRDGSHFGMACAQNGRLANFAHASNSEDCLTINVFAPSWRRKPYPVMVWIHGGGLFVGGADGYDATALAQEGVAVVTFNYRLNLFGFLGHPALAANGETGNFGLADQRAALRWVRNNIGRLGGDPKNVTIFGESAGGLSVLAHLASPLSRGLFAKAIVQSGGYGFADTGGQRSTLAAQKAGLTFAQDSGCGNTGNGREEVAACLRALQIPRMLAAEEAAGASLIIGGPDLPEPIGAAISRGHFSRVPVMIGGNQDEYRWFEALREIHLGGPSTRDTDRSRFKSRFGLETPAISKAYSASNGESLAIAYASAVGDQFFICPGQRAALALSRWTSVWNYEFADRQAPSYLPPVSFSLGAAHTSELAYLFPGFAGNEALDPAQKRLALSMRQSWAAFARFGNPSMNRLNPWPKFNASKKLTMQIKPDRPHVVTSISSDHKCSLWNSFPS